MKHDEYHLKFADAIIEQIRQGTAPWQKPWAPGEWVLPMNVDTSRSYKGGNSLHLATVQQERGYGDVRWGTYRQIQARGGQVRRGEHGTRVLSFQDKKRIAVTDERGRPKRDSEGKRVYRYERLKVPCVRQYTVFNAEQADGLPARSNPPPEPLWKAHQQADRVPQDGGVPTRHVAGDRAYYHLKHDEIVLPERGQFPSANHYYQTALHELGHSTGHPERMNRESLARLCEGGTPGRNQRHDDGRARGRRARSEPRRRLRRGLDQGARRGPPRDPPRRGRRAEDLRLRAREAPRARGDAGSRAHRRVPRARRSPRRCSTARSNRTPVPPRHEAAQTTACGTAIAENTPRAGTAGPSPSANAPSGRSPILGIYGAVSFRDLAEAHFGGHPYTTRRAVSAWVRDGLAQETRATGPEGNPYWVPRARQRLGRPVETRSPSTP